MAKSVEGMVACLAAHFSFDLALGLKLLRAEGWIETAQGGEGAWRLFDVRVDEERVDRMITGIVRRLESMGESEIPSPVIGEMVMDSLGNLDPVAYVRFASVYRNFREAKDFEDFVEDLSRFDDE